MPGAISQSLKKFFFPERANDMAVETPVKALVLAHELLLKLAMQIESHAACAPYPHIAQTLRRLGAEKHDSANKLKDIIESLGERTRPIAGEPKPGKNHWERLNLVLQDQIRLDDYLFSVELRAEETPQIAQIAKDLRIRQKSHRQVLSDLIALADPQATQT
jgi:hypothetical protein